MVNRRWRLAIGGVVAGMLRWNAASGEQPSTRVLFPPGPARLWVEAAVEGAARRLSDPRCEAVLDDFVDADQRTLTAILRARQQTPNQYLHAIWFVDGGSRSRCARVGMGAFTGPAHQVIFLCSRLFRLQLGSKHHEILVIHELLHTLGLGENPPTSERITQQITKRCGGV
jgi:hypothetical protein